ncbi:MAG: LysR family transcriptional regulator [Gammaproteobacteria bacterium]|nr:MAG: LysR family transcriptional regulator [Gammaproteobacteria bacterium]
MKKIGVRQARIFLAVANAASVTGAAKVVNRSQTSVTKSIQDLEQQLGVSLFNRIPKGVSLTAFGEALIPRAELAARAFAAAKQLVPPAVFMSSPGAARFFRMDISATWLDAFLAVVDHQNIASAADHLGIKPAAVLSSLRKLEDSLHLTLFERTPNAIVPTTLGRSIAQYVKLARSYMRNAIDEISNMQGVQVGHVSIGTMPYSRTLIVPRAINQLLADHPDLDISTHGGPLDDLVAALRCGDIDVIVGALHGPGSDGGLTEERLFDDQLSIIVRAQHPLTRLKKIEWKDLLQYPWVLPRHGTTTRKLFELVVDNRQEEKPSHVVETSSLVLLRGLLMESDRVSARSRHQIMYEERSGLLATLPVDLPETSLPIGITTRARSVLAPAVEMFIKEVRKVCRQLNKNL